MQNVNVNKTESSKGLGFIKLFLQDIFMDAKRKINSTAGIKGQIITQTGCDTVTYIRSYRR